jgi:hypothetical protein
MVSVQQEQHLGVFQEDTPSFDPQSPASAFCERSACLFTILGQVTPDPKKLCQNNGVLLESQHTMKNTKIKMERASTSEASQRPTVKAVISSSPLTGARRAATSGSTVLQRDRCAASCLSPQIDHHVDVAGGPAAQFQNFVSPVGSYGHLIDSQSAPAGPVQIVPVTFAVVISFQANSWHLLPNLSSKPCPVNVGLAV